MIKTDNKIKRVELCIFIALFLLYNGIKIGGFKLSERKTKKHRQYTIEEKNEIVKMYLSATSIVKEDTFEELWTEDNENPE